MAERMLEGRVAVVTGAHRGLGRATAMALGEAGARIAAVDIEDCAAMLAAAQEAGIEAAAFRCDVSDEAQVQAMHAAVVKRFGAAHIVVNAAGIVIRKRVADMSLAEWNQVLAVNLTGTFLTCRAFVPELTRDGYGRIVNFASVMAHISSPERAAYSASKFGVLGLTKSLAVDLAEQGVTAVAISPGAFATEMTTALRSDPARNSAILQRLALKRWCEPAEIGKLVRFLCSPDAAYITGIDVVIDAGWLAM